MDNKYVFSPIIVGTMRFGEWGVDMPSKDIEHYIDACLDMGLVDFDQADIYGNYSEELRFGEVIKRRPDLKQKMRLTTKCGIQLISERRPKHEIKSYNTSKDHIIKSAEQSLNDLGIDRIELFLIHRPDLLMDHHEVAEAVEILKQQGKINHFGVSNFTTHQFDLLSSVTPLVTNQVEASILHRDGFTNGTLNQCQRLGITPTAWSPYGGGSLFAETKSEQIKRIDKVASELAEKYNIQNDQLYLAWLLRHPSGIIPIVGTTKIERMRLALQATQVKLSREDWYKLWEAAEGKEVA